MQAEILVDLESGQKLASEVCGYLGKEIGSYNVVAQQRTSPLQSYLSRMDVFRSHVRSCLEEDIGKGLVIPGEKERLCQRLRSYDEKETEIQRERNQKVDIAGRL
jgi:hypothetical protein